MSNVLQTSTASALLPRMLETDPWAVSHSKNSTTASTAFTPSVLLVGRSSSWGAQITNSLRKFGSVLSFASPGDIKPIRDKSAAFDLILLDSTVTAEERRRLAAALLGSKTSIYYAFPVENGCWWLPALRRGEDCHGSAAFRRKEFPGELESVLRCPAEALTLVE